MKAQTILFVLLLILLATSQFGSQALAQANVTNSNLTLVGRWPGDTGPGPCYTTCVKGDYAYVGNGAALDILDISSPASPVHLGRVIIDGDVENISVAGNYAYIAAGRNGLHVIDVSKPAFPQLIGFYKTEHTAWTVFVSGNYAYVGAGDLCIIDVSNPGDPKKVASYQASIAGVTDIQVSGNYAFVACRAGGLRILDITNPESPQQVGSYYMTKFGAYSGSANSVHISGSYAYIAYGDKGLYILDVSTPASPQLIGFYKTAQSAHNVFVSGNYAYVGAGDLCIIDVCNPGDPKQVGLLVDRGGNAVVNGNYAYIASGSDGLRVLDVSTPASPYEVGFYSTGYYYLEAHGIHISDNYALVATGTGLNILDISKPENPQKVGFFDMGVRWFLDCYVVDNYAYLTDGDSLYIIDISTPTFPRQVGFCDIDLGGIFDLGGDVDIYVSDNYAYVAGTTFYFGGYGLSNIIDVHDPTCPQLIWSGVGGGSVFVSGEYAYLGGANYRLEKTWLDILDISNPSSPKEVGRYDIGIVRSIYVSGDYAFVGEYDGGLHIIDVSVPTSPKQVGKWSEGDPQEIWVFDNFAYVAGGDGILHLLDVSAPTFPQKAGFFEIGNQISDLYVSDNLVYLVAGGAGLYILRNDLLTDVNDNADQHPKDFCLIQNYPNPFNPATQISFDISTNAHVKLQIFNTRGQLIRTLVDEEMSPGTHSVTWDGSNVPSGVYFYRLTTEDFSQTRKMVLVR